MSAYLFASSVVALIVALFNGLLAGYVFASARGDRRMRFFACGPLGVALFASGWFLVLLEPRSQPSVRVAVGFAALLSLSGFIADALEDVAPARRRRLGMALVPVGLGLSGLTLLAARLLAQPFMALLPQVLAFCCVVLLGALRFSLRHHENASVRRLSWHLTAFIGVALPLGLVRMTVEWFLGGSPGNSLLLILLLVAELATLSYILHERVTGPWPVARILTHAMLALGGALVAVAGLHLAGHAVDVLQVSVSAGVAFLASVLFIGLGQQLTQGIERLLFPQQAQLAGRLAGARAEAAALRSRLERAERLAIAGELAATVAHEIKNPLAAVRGYAELLGDQAAHVPPEHRARFDKAVRIIREESDRIDARVAQLLGLGKTPRGERSGAPLDVSRMVLETVAVVEGEPDFPTLVPRLDLTLWGLGDADALRGVLLNLLKNAAEAMREVPRGRIELVTRTEAGRAIIEVRDEGKGLEGVDRERLFQPFYTTRADGTGLGLAISRSALEAVGGTLSLGPRTGGPGAVARVELLEARAPDRPEREDVR